MIFAARQLQEKCMEKHRDLYTTFADLTKAFDSVSRDGLWRIMKKNGYPSTFIAIVRQFHDGMMARVLDYGEPSEAFPVTNGVKQGCALAPTLFSMMFSAMLSDTFSDCKPGINIKYMSDGKLFNIWRLQAVPKVKETVLRDLLFADDCALNAGDEQEMQAEMDNLSSACNNFGLTISTKKTEVIYISRRHEKQINHFHLRCLRNILHIRWQDKVPDTEVLKQADIPSAITIIRKAQLRWAGHVSRMHDNRIPKQLLYGELCCGKRTAGGQRKRFNDSLKVSLKDFNIST
ncbi:hypothetical protein ACOMHN_009028 [Nucella lapillus]